MEKSFAWSFMKITEDEQALLKRIPFPENIPTHLTNTNKRLEFIAARVLINELLNTWDLSYQGLTKDEFGKPFLVGHNFQISLSHSYPYVAAVIDRKRNVGIDLEQPKPKLLKIASRVLASDELEDAGTDVVKHCVYWCAKESLVKVHGKKDLTFSENLMIDPFSLENEGELIGRIIVNNSETAIPLQYFVHESFVVVLSK
jgi:4'-phosphopantetheinyl transferase